MSNENQFEQWCKTVMSDDADFCMEYGAYKNLNVRIRWEAWHAADKSMQSAELQQKLNESERYGRQADITIENLERRVEQLAAENAALKHATGQCKEYFTALVLNQLTPYNPAVMNGTCAIALSETPATDAILAEVRGAAIRKALDDCSEFLDRDCIMESNGISYDDAALREVGAMALQKALLRQEAK
ncbi:hypothetical protein [Lelliottia sp. JS-SCA-14]|uniref:hypothetical protein n=1 Tax=Lelliottia sp. JS-SCA-14 TaxID=3110110 RepID=UPI002D79C8DD|nr:hypothetical protein [Lelliottia sp. JS-SCA-14]